MRQPTAPVKLKITLLGSTTLYGQMQAIRQRLEDTGQFLVQLPPDRITGPEGKLIALSDFYDLCQAAGPVDPWLVEAKRHSMIQHGIRIKKADCILVVNGPKNGIDGYIGPNTLSDMVYALYLGKPIFVLNELPEASPQRIEIYGTGAISLHGNLDAGQLYSAYAHALAHPSINKYELERLEEVVESYGRPVPSCPGWSAGLLAWRFKDGEQQWLIQDRARFPHAKAPSAGHGNNDAPEEVRDPRLTVKREGFQEVGLDIDLERLHPLIQGETFPSPCRRGRSSHIWFVYSYEVPPGVKAAINADESEDMCWANRAQLEELARRTDAYIAEYGEVTREEDEPRSWRANPGLEPVWCLMLRQAGVIS